MDHKKQLLRLGRLFSLMKNFFFGVFFKIIFSTLICVKNKRDQTGEKFSWPLRRIMQFDIESYEIHCQLKIRRNYKKIVCSRKLGGYIVTSLRKVGSSKSENMIGNSNLRNKKNRQKSLGFRSIIVGWVAIRNVGKH
eukprot:TRINITY_DN160_c0_g1_i10.p4 TRINITY_DN160_c0_g1~~TRINITY_DN160_c0_g1_i10.p4  ORF type:complete len:137 (-),score=13.69 TRINITY_DN160_c0_g1_i10:97-507(-)